MTFWTLFRVFLWKNLLFVRFNWLALAIIFAGCSSVVIIFLKSTYQLLTTPDLIYDAKNSEYLKQSFPANDGDYIFYAPSGTAVDLLMENVRQELQLSGDSLKTFANASEMRLIMEQNCQGNCFAIQFEQFPDAAGELQDPLKDSGYLRYSISSSAIRVSPRKRYVNDEEVSGIKDDDDYIRTGFLTLQHLIDKNFIKSRDTANDNHDYDLEISSIPAIAQEAMDGQRLITFGSIYTILFSVLLLGTFLVPLVEEKQDGLKEFLVIATPLNFLNGVTFFVVRLILYLIFLAIILGAAAYYHALGIVSLFFIIVLFVFYMLSAMSYAYLISVCFNSVFYAKVGGLLLLTIPYIFYLVKGSFSTAATFFFSTKTFMDGLEVFQIFTNKHRYFTFGDLFVNITDSSFNIFSIYACLLLQCLLYSLLYNYLSCVFPGPGGLKKPYLFLFSRSFYKKKQRNQYTTGERGMDAIIVQDLVKKFKTPTREINIADRLNMVIKNKQITVLLGHNGAGKTTTLNMIMGSEPKDSGKIIVCSERDVSSYRHLIGFCPQHSVFMHYMTCTQHLQFFAQLRGMTGKDANNLANSLLKQLKLCEKTNEYGKNLSGGMKRRLSLGIAISGDTKVVVLDEPSSGLDIESRRELWDILLELRRSKAVLVTTHHMEEAEVLGDTICILSNGRLQRTGSPLELKRKVGSGYILKLCTDQAAFREQATLDLIQQDMPTAKVLNIVPPTVLISLPYAYKSMYSGMLLQLENLREELGINSISITDTSLEDVFLNCAAEVDQVDAPTNALVRQESIRVPYQCLNTPTPIEWCQQFRAVFYKKFIFLRSEWFYTLLMLSLPFLSSLLAILLMHSMSVVKSEDVLPLNLQQIKEGIVYIRSAPNQNTYSKKIEQLLVQQIEASGKEALKLEVPDGKSVADELIQRQQNDLAHFLQNVIGLVELLPSDDGGDGVKFKIYFSGNIYHSSVMLLNLIDNVVLKADTSEQNQIETIYAPIRRFITDVSPTRLEYYAVIVPIGLFFCMFFYVSLPFKENASGFKQLQAMPRLTYWLSVLSFDLMLHFVLCVLLFVFHLALMPHELYSPYEQLLIIFSIFFYGCSYLPILYGFANGCRSISTISTYLLFMLIISAIVPLITSGSVQAMKYHDMEILFLSLLPDFNLNHQLRIINENFVIHRRNSLAMVGLKSSFLKMQPSLDSGRFFMFAIFIFVASVTFFICILENKEKRQALSNLFSCYTCRHVTTKRPIGPEEEEGLVQQEKTQVDEILKDRSAADYPLLVSSLYKFYDRKAAVCGLNFVVRKQECFGLLGVNGAGKTSTFQMITANTTITGGTIKIDGVDILDNEIQYKYRFGYCPQNDCLNNFMTSYQMLRYMAKLRGVTEACQDDEVMFWLEQLDLEKYQNVEIRHYSGGTKRKLNAAVAMIGSPSLVLLDEPTTGVDPVSRRFLWKCIQEFQKRDKTIVLTSHSMDECEQLCNRLAIMADGKFKCLGYVPELKQRYGAGFTIKVKMHLVDLEANVATITEQMRIQFPECELRENHAGMLTYFIKNLNHIAWSYVFKRTEQFAADCGDLVEDYSVNESTLEDIFLRFDTKNRRIPAATVEAAAAMSARIEEV